MVDKRSLPHLSASTPSPRGAILGGLSDASSPSGGSSSKKSHEQSSSSPFPPTSPPLADGAAVPRSKLTKKANLAVNTELRGQRGVAERASGISEKGLQPSSPAEVNQRIAHGALNNARADSMHSRSRSPNSPNSKIPPPTKRSTSETSRATPSPSSAASPGNLPLSNRQPSADTAAHPLVPWKLELDCAWSSIPHPLKVHRGGEDVHIVCRAGGATLIGVFDGVGGWAEVGVDPADYARRLGYMIEVQLRADPTTATKLERPLLVWLQRAAEKLHKEEMPGSCTACLALLTDEVSVVTFV